MINNSIQNVEKLSGQQIDKFLFPNSPTTVVKQTRAVYSLQNSLLHIWNKGHRTSADLR